MTNSFVALGHMSAGQTVQVKLPLNTLSTNSGATLADQMASSKGLPTPYGDAVSGGLPIQNELQRHLAILSALSDGGFPFCGQGPCNVSASGYVVGKRGGIFFSGGSGGGVTNGVDPLLVPDSPVTLIGWADGPTDVTSTVTVNGATPSGLQETLIQAPLSVNLSGILNLPANFINAQLVDVQGKNVQNQPANTYTMTTGSVTFEFVVPNSTELQVTSFTISEPSNLTQVLGQPIASGSTTVVDAGRLQAYLYNWRTGAWDSILLSNYSFSTGDPDPYIGPGGRILLQLANQDNSIGTILFGKPSLDLQGSVS
jgi:hypothetical protein